jgi:hypothetical protein
MAKASDAVVMLMGINLSIENEDHDRSSIDLPEIQHQLIAYVAAAVGPSIPVVVVLM